MNVITISNLIDYDWLPIMIAISLQLLTSLRCYDALTFKYRLTPRRPLYHFSQSMIYSNTIHCLAWDLGGQGVKKIPIVY